ncbi:hypothetical protein IC608_16075 [Devosia sp. PTR5]|uniref:Integrase catalytic domain-containing protein n=1 Tax=Devosia oryzisoli TaxID=2774138 RepID=A0A927FXM1_9HYPH|nr:hypothetical protein [Devosia oryzisoli]MBD8066989.1 hypothetical protein [Devosia oryzisoli]
MKALPLPSVQFGQFDRILFGGTVECRYSHKGPTDYYFDEVEHPGRCRSIPIAELDKWIDNPRKLRIDRDYYTFQKVEQRAKSAPTLAELSAVAAAGVSHRYALVMAWRAALNDIPLNYPHREQIALDQVYFEVALQFARREVRSTLSCKQKPISLSTLLVWNRRLRAFDDDPAALVDGRHKGSGNRTARFTPFEEKLIDWAIGEYLQPTKPSIRHVWHRLFDEVKRQNLLRDTTCDPVVKCPCYESFKLRIAAISRFIKHASRNGLASAEKFFRASYGGQDYSRPGQRMEVDGWLCHLHTLVEESAIWAHLPAEIRTKLKKVRVTFVVVIDVATHSILGIHFSWSESAAAITAALRMSMENKSKLAETFGLKSSWPQYGWGNWVHDRAGVYDEAELVQKILKGMNGTQASIPGVPWLRPTIEAFFKTIASDLLAHFTGQTGSNFNNRTDFQHAGQASITVDELVAKTIEWVVEKYHHTKSSLGMTPIAAWHKLCELAPPPPRHGPAKMIEIFGERKRRTLGVTGINLAGSQFQSPELQRLRRLTSQTTVETWVDYENLGQILVKVPEPISSKIRGHVDGWLMVEGPRELAGISLRHINMVDDDLAIRFGYDKATSEKRATEARTGLATFARDAALLRLTENAPSLEYIEKRLNKSYHFALGDEEFRKEREALHAPIKLPAGNESRPVHNEDQDEHSISISFGDGQ